MLAGRHVNSEHARRIPFRVAQIESETPFSLQLDGEPMLGAAHATIEVVPNALEILAPPGAARLMCKNMGSAPQNRFQVQSAGDEANN